MAPNRRTIIVDFFSPPKAKGGGGNGAPTPGCCPNMGFWLDCPSAAYEFVMESMTDCAFSWPISVGMISVSLRGDIPQSICSFNVICGWGTLTLVIIHHIPQMISAAVVRLPDAHRIVRKIYIAVVTCKGQHCSCHDAIRQFGI